MARTFEVDGHRRTVTAEGGRVRLGEARTGFFDDDDWFALGAVLVVVVCGLAGVLLLGTSAHSLAVTLLVVAGLAILAVVVRWLVGWAVVFLGAGQAVLGLFTRRGRRDLTRGVGSVPGGLRDAAARLQPRELDPTGMGPLAGRWRPGFELQISEGPVRISARWGRRDALERLQREIWATSTGE